MSAPPHDENGFEIRIRGRVQGVGFRPTVWRVARELGLAGEVRNDADGVLIRVAGSDSVVRELINRLEREPPPLARIEQIESRRISLPRAARFRIAASAGGAARTEIAPDAAVCGACVREILDPGERRYGYPFANCTHCGPRLSIVTAIPFDRGTTTMAPFELCPACAGEYRDPADRRFHAEAIACPACGPRARLVRWAAGEEAQADYGVHGESVPDAAAAVGHLLQRGEIVALKGIGGYQLACDATNEAAVLRLREGKRREAKPFALMARGLDVIRRYCSVSSAEERELSSSTAPIVLLSANGSARLPDAVAPGLRTLGFMVPTTPLHVLALRDVDRPVVMTSGNCADEPQAVDDLEAAARLRGIARYACVHDRAIASRVDDSVVRVIGGVGRLLRRARGFAPAPIRLPRGFEAAPELLAFGGELKATFCLVRAGQAVLSQHQGDLEDAATFDEYRRNLALYAKLFDHAPQALAADAHPEYLPAKLARERARVTGVPLLEVQHHHAHVAGCLAEHGRPLAAPPVLGIVLDGLGWGGDGTLWGGELLLADYRRARRLGSLEPIAMIGGSQAVREPWRNLYAHLRATLGWAELGERFGDLDLYRFLARKPRAVLEAMLRNGMNSPSASSCGRLFDAVAAALGICPERQAYEGEAASRLEALAAEVAPGAGEAAPYPFAITECGRRGLASIDARPMWQALLGDLSAGRPGSLVAARFHAGLGAAMVNAASILARPSSGGPRFDTVALSGGCFQNPILLGAVTRGLETAGFVVLTHARVPANDGGLALGQAAVAAARLLAPQDTGKEESDDVPRHPRPNRGD